LGMVFATRVEEMQEWNGSKELEEVRGLCGVEGVQRGMGPGDEMWIGTGTED
jgi:hypothetical protein